jgi:hypothetical protein
MLRNFTAALIATTLVAGSAFAAQPSATTAAPAAAPAASTQNAVKPVTAPAASSAQAVAKPADTAKSVKVAKHIRKPLRRHTAHVVKPGTEKNVKASA